METAKIVKVERGLQSFITEIGRVTKTSGAHYWVETKNNVITVVHHNYKWIVKVLLHEINVYTDDDILTITRAGMTLNGQEVIEICDSKQCYTREDIVTRVILAIALAGVNTPWLYKWTE
jgi:hypothetical protein